MSQPREPGIVAEPADAPDAHGKFSLNEDWAATLFGLGLLALCLLQVTPDIKGWF